MTSGTWMLSTMINTMAAALFALHAWGGTALPVHRGEYSKATGLEAGRSPDAPASSARELPRGVIGRPGMVTVLDSSITWDRARRWELAGPVLVTGGGTLTIEAGTRLEARPGAFIDVTRDGRIIADGTLLQPIVMTCTSTPTYPGCWGGLTVRGHAQINFGTAGSPPARGDGSSGCRESGTGESAYGGCDDADSSGVIRFVRVENAAVGLQLLAAGSGTVVDHVQVNRSLDDGLSIVGGAVDVRHQFLTASGGYGLAWRGGWRGRGQFLTVQQDALRNAGGISGSNFAETPGVFLASPRSAPALYNVTVVAPSVPANPMHASAPPAIHMREGTGGSLRNVLVYGAEVAFDIDDEETCLAVSTPAFALTNVVVAGVTALGATDGNPASCGAYSAPDTESDWLNDVANAATIVTDPVEIAELVRTAFDLDLPDLRPASGGATVSTPAATPPTDGFFDVAATYVGAMPANVPERNEIPWYSGWTVAAPIPPLPGTATGVIASAIRGPFSGALISAALGTTSLSSPTGEFSLALPAGEHLLTASLLPVGCNAAPLSITVPSGAVVTADIAAECNAVARMSVGSFHACALASTGEAQCWGQNDFGMVGDGTLESPRPLPVLVALGLSYQLQSLGSGYTHSCALRNGAPLCWGLNFFGALGLGSSGLAATIPVAAGNSGTPLFTQLSVGGYHSCALTAAGATWCWGWNQEGQAGQPTTSATVLTPALANAGPLTFTQLAAGESHTCGLTASGDAYCWGGNGRGELGTDPLLLGTQSTTPVLVPGGHTFATLDAGTLHTCGITTTGEAYCWGSQEFGQLGNGVVGGSSNGPVLVSGGTTFVRIAAGGQTTCAVTTSQTVQCWGSGESGALGDGSSTAAQATPVSVAGGLAGIADVFVNLSTPPGATACAYTTLGDAYCWGAGTAGQLGTGQLTSSPVPVQVVVRGPQ